ncbi:MAG: hypothetical protein ABIK09_00690 [Pseudomonadota bacterium]
MRMIMMTLLVLGAAPGAAVGAAAPPRTIIYEGNLRSGDGTPVSGIYWMRFSLRRDQDADAELWSEQSYVAVDAGRFVVELGKRRAFPPALELGGLFLMVVNDGLVLMRSPVDPSWISDGAGGGGGQGCETCRRATVSDNSTRFAGLDLDQLKAILARTLGPGGKRRLTSVAGSTDGESFTLECPPGHMLTGLEGTAADGLRSLRLICRPMEAR